MIVSAFFRMVGVCVIIFALGGWVLGRAYGPLAVLLTILGAVLYVLGERLNRGL